jgi:hypothetical protein
VLPAYLAFYLILNFLIEAVTDLVHGQDIVRDLRELCLPAIRDAVVFNKEHILPTAEHLVVFNRLTYLPEPGSPGYSGYSPHHRAPS